jgi:hexulose-6-phosphate isomerase
MHSIGFMQGRLSPVRNGKIQSFPWDTWRDEFEIASANDLRIMEWTIDSENFQSNPIIEEEGQSEIERLRVKYNISIPSVTCDYFMENPVWAVQDKKAVERDLILILEGMSRISSRILVIPLVDNSSMRSPWIEKACINFFVSLREHLVSKEIKIAFECDLPPTKLKSFIENFEPNLFGINYDIGNSASLGFDPKEEFENYGNRIINIHVKDRLYRGITVPLGEGDANFRTVFQQIRSYNYVGNLIMQTARDPNLRHVAVLLKYKEIIIEWMKAVTREQL